MRPPFLRIVLLASTALAVQAAIECARGQATLPEITVTPPKEAPKAKPTPKQQAKAAQKIFLSYRRSDSAGSTGRVHDSLEREFGGELLFMDVDSIRLGANFVRVLQEEVGKCDVLLAFIGRGWLDAKDDDGHK